MKILFVLSGNKDKTSGPVYNQAASIRNYAPDVEIELFSVKGKGARGYLNNIRSLRRKVRAYDPDLIHAHYSFCGFLSALSFTGKPVLTSLMGSDLKLKWHWRLVLFLMSGFWKAIIVKSKAMYKSYWLAETHVIPNGVDLEKYPCLEKTQAREQLGLSRDKIYVLFLADPQRKEKNFRLAKQAFKALEMPDAELLVKYQIPHEHTRLYYYAADALLLSSLYEGSPNVVKEAMVCNCPIVATPVGDVEWLFGETEGHFIAGFDVPAFSGMMNKAIGYAREKDRTRGRERIRELGLDAETVTEKIVTLYQRLSK